MAYIMSKTYDISIKEIVDYIKIETEYKLFMEYMETSNYLLEFTNVQINESIKSKLEFIKNVAQTLKVSVSDIAKLVSNKKVFTFFSKVKWSITKLFEMAKNGYKTYLSIIDVISEYIANTKVAKWTENELIKLDEFLKKHPKTKRIAGIAVAGLLIFIWFNMTFTGDYKYDFDISDVVASFSGSFTLSKLFAGSNGIKLLLLFASGSLLGLTFPWPGAATKQFVGAVIYTLSSKIKQRLNMKMVK